ncbi:MAG TPA: N-acetylneuraminate synthase family protein [Gemmatimonadaceae bacterium]|nr:N-acetylneuraminate synthase family protein [Gemmatimonadaceae bacterium]
MAVTDAISRAAAIKVLLTDCDGVLTDGSVYCGADGEALLQFSRRDGMGVARLREMGVDTEIVTRESSPIVARRAEKLGIAMVHLGVMDKRRAIQQIIASRGVTAEQVAYIGDDVNDLEALGMVGLAACPADAEVVVRHRVHKVLRRTGGKGALRELAEFIIEAKTGGGVRDAEPAHEASSLRLVIKTPRRWRKVGGRAIGDGEPVYVIGEIGINHNGSLEMAKKLIDGAIAAGCDCVKFQKRTPELCVPVEQQHLERDTPWGRITYLDYRHRIEFNFAQYVEIDRYCRDRGIAWTASCWDEPSVECIAAFDVPFIKVASASITDHTLLRRVVSQGVPVMLSSGMSTQDEIDAAAAVVANEQLLIAHSTSAYPCPSKELNLRMIETLAEKYPGVPIGYSGHEVGLATTYAAVALGASFIERHITLDRALWGSDQSASVEIVGLMRLVRDVRAIEEALGDGVKCVYASEQAARRRLRRESGSEERVATA